MAPRSFGGRIAAELMLRHTEIEREQAPLVVAQPARHAIDRESSEEAARPADHPRQRRIATAIAGDEFGDSLVRIGDPGKQGSLRSRQQADGDIDRSRSVRQSGKAVSVYAEKACY